VRIDLADSRALGSAKERTTLEVVDDMASWRENHALGWKKSVKKSDMAR